MCRGCCARRTKPHVERLSFCQAPRNASLDGYVNEEEGGNARSVAADEASGVVVGFTDWFLSFLFVVGRLSGRPSSQAGDVDQGSVA